MEKKNSISLDEGVRMNYGANLKVVGVGGAGGNAVNRMISANMTGVEFIVANTDVQALKNNLAPVKLQIGSKVTKGLGAGSNPEVGRNSALEDTEKIIELLEGADMVFITGGLGGGTGTGAMPIISSLSVELGALAVAVVTKPFDFEGKARRAQAERGLAELKECVDTVITIPNERLLQTVEKGTTLMESFRLADDVLRQAVQGISDLITVTGEINLDFADVKTIMSGMGMAVMGTGIGKGETRAIEAAQRAISSPLLEEACIDGARGILINITGGEDMTLHEVAQASTIVHDAAHEEANIIFGTVIDKNMKGEMKITVIATGFEQREAKRSTVGGFRTASPTSNLYVPADRASNGFSVSASPSASSPAAPVVPEVRPAEMPLQAAVGAETTPAENLAFYRKGSSGFGNGESPYASRHASREDDLEVPTFLRRQND